jgi:hypothetical protein
MSVEKTTSGYRVTANIYVKRDGKTVCANTDKDVAFLKYATGEGITEGQHAALIFPNVRVAEPVPDAATRSGSIADAETRRGGRKKLG